MVAGAAGAAPAAAPSDPDCPPEHAAMALASSYDHPIIVDRWRLPLGAFGDSQGPT